MNKPLTVFTDGGSRGNPGPAALGVCIKSNSDSIVQFGKSLGIATNNTAEYQAVVAGLDWLLAHAKTYRAYAPISFAMDSLLVCSQINGVYKMKSLHLKKYLSDIKTKRKQVEVLYAQELTFFHIPRANNKCADAMVNKALDE